MIEMKYGRRKNILLLSVCVMAAIVFCIVSADLSFAADKAKFDQLTTKAGVRSSALDKNANVWIGTYGGGLYMKNGKTCEVTVYDKQALPELKTTTISAVCPDADGGVWFTQNASYTNPNDNCGVVYMKDGKLTFYRQFDEPATIPNDYVQAIEIDKDGNVWFGSFGGLTKYDPAAGTWQTWDSSDGFPAMSVDAIEFDKNGGIWCGFYPESEAADGSKPFTGGFAYFKNGKVVKSYKYTSIQDPNTGAYRLGDVWVRDITIDAKGGIWVIASGSYAGMANTGGKVFYVKSTNAKPVEFSGFDLFGEKAFSADSELRVADLDPDGGLWFGTSKDGVFRVDNNTISKGKLSVKSVYCKKNGSWESESSGIDNIYSLDFLGKTVNVGSSAGLQTAVITSMKSAAAGKKKVTVKWKKSSKADGYQVYLKRSGKAAKTYTVKKSALSKTVRNLKSGKKYSVKVRAYVNSDSGKMFGTWSHVKSVKVK